MKKTELLMYKTTADFFVEIWGGKNLLIHEYMVNSFAVDKTLKSSFFFSLQLLGIILSKCQYFQLMYW